MERRVGERESLIIEILIVCAALCRNASGSGGNTARSTGLHRMGANASVEINKVLDVESAKPADAR